MSSIASLNRGGGPIPVLQDYLPLGCLCFEKSTHEVLVDRDPDVWIELSAWSSSSGGALAQAAEINDLLRAAWIRVTYKPSILDSNFTIYRLYVLPADVGNCSVDRQNKRLVALLDTLVLSVDISSNAWEGRYERQHVVEKFDTCATLEPGSLFYIYNTLPSPAPDPCLISDHYSREALEDLLDSQCSLHGLKSVLYPYQRRSAGLMLQRETAPRLNLDPRFERRIAPDGSQFYFAPRDMTFMRHARYYEACKGGILSETMGLGKTVMVLALVLATKHHLPRIPPQFNLPVQRKVVGSLTQMAASSIIRSSIPWKVEFERIRHATGREMSNCAAKVEQQSAHYEIPQEPSRWNRTTTLPSPKSMVLAATTLLVVPPNLFKQWQSEIEKHVETGALRVLAMDDMKKALPSPEILRTYDIVLFTRNRWQSEHRDGADEQGRRQNKRVCSCPYLGSTRIRDCNCVKSESLYDSPLKYLHFKRLVVDEGHFFSNTDSRAVSVATSLVTTDHRWAISGTPAKNLFGIEVDALSDSSNELQQTEDDRDAALEQRRNFSIEDTTGAIKSFGKLVSKFLNVRPWAALDKDAVRVDWDEYIYRHESRKRTYSGFSPSLRRTLESLVIKTQPSDVEKDLELPPLSHQIIRLEPSFFDKITVNLFTLVLTANAVTSERSDMDYLFHKNSSKALRQLISNLRQSAFFWTGFSEMDIIASMENSEKYLSKESAACSPRDRELVEQLLLYARKVLNSKAWTAMSRTHELGIFAKDWRRESAMHWAFEYDSDYLLTGVSQILEAQRFVNEHDDASDPGQGLVGAGIRALFSAHTDPKTSKQELKDDGEERPTTVLTKSGIPASSLDGEPSLKRRQSMSKNDKSRKNQEYTTTNTNGNSARKRRISELDSIPDLAPTSPYLHCRVVGTVSSKLSYLLSRVLELHKSEKILVFYEGDNLAYYIAQALEVLHINHEIYARSLKSEQKSEYVVKFEEEDNVRVLLMDVNQAAHGLNMPSASRIFFVNPVCRPNVEAQAIKRAHRIGQTRKVFVETLVLKGTIEEDMLERSRRMTHTEHLDAKTLEDDGGIREIIQNVKPLIVADEEFSLRQQMAPLAQPQQLWGRPGWRESIKLSRGHSSAKRRRPNEQKSREASVTATTSGLSIAGSIDPRQVSAIVRIPAHTTTLEPRGQDTTLPKPMRVMPGLQSHANSEVARNGAEASLKLGSMPRKKVTFEM